MRVTAILLWAVSWMSAGEVDPTTRARIEEAIQASGAETAVALRTLDGESSLFIRPDDSFHAASTMKVPVMIELFRQAREGRLTVDDPLLVRNRFRSIVDGSFYSIEPEADGEVYRSLGKELPLLDLCRQMIAVSSNLATNLLIERLGPENIQKTVDAWGGRGMKVLRGVEDIKAFRKGLSNSTTARGLFVLMEKIGHLEAVDEDASRRMIEILKTQHFRDGIPAGLPRGVEVANKTGEITEIHHDAALVWGPRPFALVILTRGLADREKSAAHIAHLTSILYESLTSRIAD